MYSRQKTHPRRLVDRTALRRAEQPCLPALTNGPTGLRQRLSQGQSHEDWATIDDAPHYIFCVYEKKSVTLHSRSRLTINNI